MPGLVIQVDTRGIEKACKRLSDLHERVSDLSEPMEEIGQYLVRSVKNRIKTSKTSPDGTPWARNSDLTIELKGRNSPNYDTGRMAAGVHVADSDRDSVSVAVDASQAAALNNGFTNRGKYGHGKPVPARPFMGISTANKKRMSKIITDYIVNGHIEEEETFGA